MPDIHDEIDTLRDATREAHETMRDLAALVKEAREVIGGVSTEINTDVVARIDQAVAVGLETYSAVVDQAITDATDAVYARFDTILEVLMGQTKTQRRKTGVPPLPELLQTAQAAGLLRQDVDLSGLNRSIADEVAGS